MIKCRRCGAAIRRYLGLWITDVDLHDAELHCGDARHEPRDPITTVAEERTAVLRLAHRLSAELRQSAERALQSDRRYLDARCYDSEAEGIDRLAREIEAGAHFDESPSRETP